MWPLYKHLHPWMALQKAFVHVWNSIRPRNLFQTIQRAGWPGLSPNLAGCVGFCLHAHTPCQTMPNSDLQRKTHHICTEKIKEDKEPAHVSSSHQTRLAYKMQAQTLLATKSIADMGQEHSPAKVLKPLLLQRPLANTPPIPRQYVTNWFKLVVCRTLKYVPPCLLKVFIKALTWVFFLQNMDATKLPSLDSIHWNCWPLFRRTSCHQWIRTFGWRHLVWRCSAQFATTSDTQGFTVEDMKTWRIIFDNKRSSLDIMQRRAHIVICYPQRETKGHLM